MQIKLPKRKIKDFCQRWKITELALFGSVLRDDFRPDSDIDVLVTFQKEARWSLLDLARMENELSLVLGREVDLVERQAVEKSENYLRRQFVLEHIEPVYVAR